MTTPISGAISQNPFQSAIDGAFGPGTYDKGARSINNAVGGEVLPVSGAATKQQVRSSADAYLSKISNGKITNVGQLAEFAGDNKAANRLRGQLNKYLASGTNSLGITDYKQLLTPAESKRLDSVVRRRPSDTPSATRSPTLADYGRGATAFYNNSIAAPLNAMAGTNAMPVIGGKTVQEVRTGADAFISKASGGKITSVGQLAQFDGGNRAANKLRGQVNAYLKNGSNDIGIVDYKSLLTPAERQRLTSVNAQTVQKKSAAESSLLPPHLRGDVKPKWGVMREFDYRSETPAQTAARKEYYKQGNIAERSDLAGVGKTELKADPRGNELSKLSPDAQLNVRKAQSFGDTLANSGFIGVAQFGEVIKFGVDGVKGLNGMVAAAPEYFKSTGDLITGCVKVNPTEALAGGISGTGKAMWSAGTGLLDIGARGLVPGERRDKTADTMQRGQQALNGAYEGQMKRNGVDPKSTSYTSGSGTAQIVTTAVLLSPKVGGGKAGSKKTPAVAAGANAVESGVGPSNPSKSNVAGFGTNTLGSTPGQVTLKTKAAPANAQSAAANSTFTPTPAGIRSERSFGSAKQQPVRSPTNAVSPGVATANDVAALKGGSNNIVNFGSKKLRPGSEWPGTSGSGSPNTGGAGNTGGTGKSRPTGSGGGGGYSSGSAVQSGTQTQSGGVATASKPSVHATNPAGFPAANPTAVVKPTWMEAKTPQMQAKPQPKPVFALVEPPVLLSPPSPRRPSAPGDASPTFPTAPKEITLPTKPARPGTGDQPGKGIPTSIAPEEQKKLDGWLRKHGTPIHEQKLNAYRSGAITKEQMLEGTSGDERAALINAMNQIDRARIGGGGASGGSGGSYSSAQVKEIWRQVDAYGVDKLPESQVRQLIGVTEQALKDPNLSAGDRIDLQRQLAGAKNAQRQYHTARKAGANNPAVDTSMWNIPAGQIDSEAFFSNQRAPAKVFPGFDNNAEQSQPKNSWAIPSTYPGLTQPIKNPGDQPAKITMDRNVATRQAPSITPSNQPGLNDSSGLHPYVGNALSRIPAHQSGTIIIIGDYPDDMVEPGSNNIVKIDENMSTLQVWSTNWRIEVPETGNGPIHVYRTFQNGLTQERMAMKVDPNKPYTANPQDQRAMNKLAADAGLSIKIPLFKKEDESPSNVIASTTADVQALRLMRAASAAGANLDRVPVVIPNALGMNPGLSTTQPANWMLHYFNGSGKAKVLSERAMTALQSEFYRNEPKDVDYSKYDGNNDKYYLSQAINVEVNEARANGHRSGYIEQYVPHKSTRAPQIDGLYLTVGGYEPGTVFKGKWTLDSEDNVVFSGQKYFVAQDRYNWGVPELNGDIVTATIFGVPSFVMHQLPQPYINAFKNHSDATQRGQDIKHAVKLAPGSRHLSVDDKMFGHLQMVKGGAQPFWTIGISKPIPVDVKWKLDGK